MVDSLLYISMLWLLVAEMLKITDFNAEPDIFII